MAGLPDIPPGIEKQANDALNALIAQLPVLQSSYFASHGKYWQGIITPPIVPANGNKEAPDKSRKPTDQSESWQDFGVSLPATAVISYAVDVQQSPDGWSFTASGFIDIAGKHYRRTGAGDWFELQQVIP